MLLTINQLPQIKKVDFTTLSNTLEQHIAPQSIAQINWKEYDHKPNVQFRMAYRENLFFLKFNVEGDYTRALETKTNGNVHEDSCVEFFFDPKGDGTYYNLEINCIGTIKLGYGTGRDTLTYLPETLIEQCVQAKSSLGKTPFEAKKEKENWELTVIVHKKVFVTVPQLKLKGLKTKANFYKCGDKTKVPHFVSWNPIHTKTPDYHRPEFFGELKFE